ncbi:unnamed protein product [Cladocopium goreaui]|uniref:Probable dihydrofolate synthetase (DHFS) n=1 Tax=Cladocopium goreaui TaxID=2562237 RepID=A0A9P1FYL2_9DINO|nr:unnamed protein product [Cladocopium goreaui]
MPLKWQASVAKAHDVALRGRCLHVAGTNGKGSVCAMMFAVCKHAGLRVGMLTSPHLLEPLDAIYLAGSGKNLPIEPKMWRMLEDEVQKACCIGAGYASESAEVALTVFELQVVTALLFFARQQVDVAIIEVGMGGRDDATNVLLEPAACCITSIALDHEKFLGPTHEEIAKHKAGIFQRGRPAFVATNGMSGSVQQVIAEIAHSVGAPLSWIPPADLGQSPSHGARPLAQFLQVKGFSHMLQVPLLGDYQRSNAALALALLLELRSSKLPLKSRPEILEGQLDDLTIVEGLKATAWPGRLDWRQLDDGRKILLDGAHNPHAAKELGSYVAHFVRPQPVQWIIALSYGKDAKGILQELLQDEDSLIAVSFSKVEAMPWVRPESPAELVKLAREVRPTIRAKEAATFQEAIGEEVQNPASVKPQIVICGSLYLVADVIATLQSEAQWAC